MSIRSKIKIEKTGVFFAAIFYAIVGIVFFVLLPLANFPPHIGIIAIMSLVAAYGLYEKRNWTLYPVVILFFIVTVFGLYTIYFATFVNVFATVGAIVFLVLTWIATIYTTARRRALET